MLVWHHSAAGFRKWVFVLNRCRGDPTRLRRVSPVIGRGQSHSSVRSSFLTGRQQKRRATGSRIAHVNPWLH